MNIDKIKKAQIYADVAKLHITNLNSGFLPSLGVKFLSLMYRCIDESKFTILILKYTNDKLSGFVTGSIGTSNLFKMMLKHPIDLIFSLLPVVFNFKKIINIINILKYISGTKRKKYPKAELLSICVHPEYRKQGIGIELYQKLLKYFESNSVKEFVIIVGQSLEANYFYKKQGAKIIGEIKVHENNNSNIFIQKV